MSDAIPRPSEAAMDLYSDMSVGSSSKRRRDSLWTETMDSVRDARMLEDVMRRWWVGESGGMGGAGGGCCFSVCCSCC
jgi:hypothetical protein